MVDIYILSLFAAHKYHNREEFLKDVELISINAALYNGQDSPFTKKAENLLRISKETLDEVKRLFH